MRERVWGLSKILTRRRAGKVEKVKFEESMVIGDSKLNETAMWMPSACVIQSGREVGTIEPLETHLFENKRQADDYVIAEFWAGRLKLPKSN